MANKTCLITPDLAGPTRNGGIGTHCLYLARFLARRGDAVTLVHTGPPDDVDRETWRATFAQQHGVDLRWLDELPDEPAVPVLPHTERHRTSHRLYHWLRNQDFATIHFQDWQGNGAVCTRAKQTGAAFAHTRLVVTTHGSSEWIRAGMHQFPAEGRETLIDDVLERTAVALADTVISPSEHLVAWMREHDWTLPRDTRVVPYLFEAPAAAATPARSLAPGALRELVFFGRLETRKGIEPFLDALATFAKSPSAPDPLQVHFVGKPHTTLRGPAREVIEAVAATLPASATCEIHDRWNHGEALTWLQKHPQALVVMPSLADNAPFAVIECLALGQPLLAGDRGGIPELIASSAHLVDPTSAALAARLTAIARDGLPATTARWNHASAEHGWEKLARDIPAPTTPPAWPKISVCVPHFNHPAALAELLAGLAGQSMPPHEVIVADDGSDSEHSAAWEQLATQYGGRGWRFLREPHAGPSAARNAAARLASGDMLVFCDADNRPRPTMLEQLGRALVTANADIVTCSFSAHLAAPDGSWTETPEYVFAPLGAALELALLENFIGDTNFIVRRDVFRRLGGFDVDNRVASEDWQLLLRAILAGHAIAVSPDVAFQYRLAPASHARRHSPREAALAAWQSLPVAERSRFGRLLESARGTFSALADLGATPAAFAALESTRNHARNLEQTVAARTEELALLRQHAENLDRSVAAARAQLEATARHAANLDRSVIENRAQLESTRHHATNLEQINAQLRRDLHGHRAAVARVHELETVSAQLTRELATARETLEVAREEIKAQDRQRLALAQQYTEARDEIERLRQGVEERDRKIHRMQATLSWRLTAPFRAMRRQLSDRFFAPGATPPPNAAHQNAPFLISVDVPSVWEAAPCVGTFTGWCISTVGQPPQAIRATVGAQQLPGRHGLRRADVAIAHKFTNPEAPLCGFQIPYRLLVDADHEIVIEVQNAAGAWITVLTRTLHTSSFPRAVRDYTAWVETFGKASPERVGALRGRLARLPADHRPLLSVLLPVYNAPERFLIKAIESVRNQIYDHWELCIADDCSTAPHVRPVLEKFAHEDARIHVVFREKNGHISHASNSALELVRGDFIVLLDHDDELSWDALAEVALTLAAHPDADAIYSDEDKIDEAENRYDPYFKPDFLPDLLAGQNCLSHLSVLRTKLVRAVGGFRPGYEGSQDWDLALRVIDASTPNHVRHIPKVLYHWRAISGSTAIEVSEKSYSLDAARRALLDHFARRGISVDVRPVPGSHWQVVYPLPESPPLVSLVIPTRDAAKVLRTCLESVLAHTSYAPFEIVLVNNRTSAADACALLEEFSQRPNVRVIDVDAAFNFSALVNRGVQEAKGEIVVLLNNDVEAIDDRWLTELVSHAVRPEIGAVGAMLYYPNQTIQHAGIVLGLGGVGNNAFGHLPRGTDGYKNRARLAQNYSAVTAACLAIRRAVYLEVGGFNETDLAVAFNDVDFCIRVRNAGYRNLWTPFAELIHHESVSRGREDTPEKQARFDREIAYMRSTWGDQLDHDPAYSTNLALSMEGWDLAWPPRT